MSSPWPQAPALGAPVPNVRHGAASSRSCRSRSWRVMRRDRVRRRRTTRLGARARDPSRFLRRPPAPQVISVRTLHLQLPVNQRRVTAIGYAAGNGAHSRPSGSRRTKAQKRLWHAVVGGGGGGPRWYQLPGGTGPPTSALDVELRPGQTPTRRSTARSSGSTAGARRAAVRPADRHPAGRRAVLVVGLARARRPVARRGLVGHASSSRLGRVLDFPWSRRRSRATTDAGNHILVEVHPAATLQIP